MRILPVLLLVGCPHGPSGQYDGGEAPLRVYGIQPGDTLAWIAGDLGVPGGWPSLAELNHLRNPHLIYAGAKLKVASNDDRLPLWPRNVARGAPLAACPAQPLAPAVSRRLSGCDAAACVDVGSGYQACACDSGGARSLKMALGANVLGSTFVYPTDASWYEPGSEPPGPPTALTGARYQLDADPAAEVVVAWRQELNDLGMSRWQVAIFDEPGSSRAPITFEAANWGEGSVIDGAAGCEVLATEWLLTDEPGRDQDGWYLLGRRAALRGGGLAMLDGPVLARRRLDSYTPGATRAGNVGVGTPLRDLNHANTLARTTDPAVEHALVTREAGRVVSTRRTIAGQLAFTLATGSTTRDDTVEPTAGRVRRLGDLSTGRLYPPAYVPSEVGSLAGRPLVVSTYAPPWWGEPWSVAWLDGR